MAKKIQAWAAYGPKIALGDPMKKEELIENIIAKNQNPNDVIIFA